MDESADNPVLLVEDDPNDALITKRARAYVSRFFIARDPRPVPGAFSNYVFEALRR